MPVAAKLKAYLEEQGVEYEVLTHGEVYTSMEVAAAQHVPGDRLAKVVIVESGGKFIMLVLPSTRLVDFQALSKVLGGKARLSTEEEFEVLFPDCETGAMPPFGNLYGLEVYVDESLAGIEDIVFEAGSHYETIRMRYEDLERLVSPSTATFARHV